MYQLQCFCLPEKADTLKVCTKGDNLSACFCLCSKSRSQTAQNQQLENNTYTYEQIVEQLGDSTSDVIQGMTKVEGGTMVSLEPIIEVVQPSAPTSFFDKLCNFFAKLFGR